MKHEGWRVASSSVRHENDEVARLGSDFDRTEVLDVRWFKRAELVNLNANGIVENLPLSPLPLLLLRGEKL